jgi:hypothetical protein
MRRRGGASIFLRVAKEPAIFVFVAQFASENCRDRGDKRTDDKA